MNGSGADTATASSLAATASGLTVTLEGTGRSVAVDASGGFRLADVPAGDARLRFSGGNVNATTVVSNVSQGEQIQIQVSVNGGTAIIVTEVRSASKIQLCHRTDAGQYHLIEVSTSAEPAHLAHGDGGVGDRVPGTLTKVFGANCQPVGVGVTLEKLTNGHDADAAPGPSIPVGAAVTWTYLVTNNGPAALTNILVVDDKGVVVSCPKTTLAVGESMTCAGTGLAAVGQYRNVGTVTATSVNGAVSDADPSHYLGVLGEERPANKVQLCHRTGNGRYHLIEVSINAEPAHRAHGDGKVGEAVPGNPGKVFLPGCAAG